MKKNKLQITERFKNENHRMNRKHRTTRNTKHRTTRYDEINNMTIDWFRRVRAMDARISGPMLQEAALLFAEKNNFPEFKASNGWLEAFKKRYQVSWKTLSGRIN